MKSKVWRGLPIAMAVLIFVTSSTVIGPKAFVHGVASASPVKVTEQGFGQFWNSWWWLFVKGYHVTEFAVLTYLLGRWLTSKPVWVATLLALAYAATDEFHQLYIPNRGGHVTDVMIDFIGISAASLLLIWTKRTK